MFNIGDLLVGENKNGYNVTNETCLCEVCGVNTNDTINVKVIACKNSEKDTRYKGQIVYNLDASKFHIASIAEQNAIRGIKAPKEKADLKIKLSGFTIAYYPNSVQSDINLQKKTGVEIEPKRLEALNGIRANYTGQKSIFDFKEIVDLSVFDEVLSPGARKAALSKMIDFFKEFQYTPSLRFVNVVAHKLEEAGGFGSAIQYINNYFKLMDNPYCIPVSDKIRSDEFNGILTTLGLIPPANWINKRLTVYFGAPGAGKTYRALEEAEGRCIVCNASMLPSDLIEDFSFVDGKPGFQRSILRECMEDGKPLVLDELNLLGLDSVRFLQGLLDNKEEIIYKGETIHIKEGFRIIGTMNLNVGGSTFGLPEPLVDRCVDIKEFEMDADKLLAALE